MTFSWSDPSSVRVYELVRKEDCLLGISACLAGVFCRYDGRSNEISELRQLVAEHQAIVVCPEVLGGLPTPRTPAEIIGGDGFAVWEGRAKVVDQKGRDVTEAFKNGARQALEKLQAANVTTLILKEKSPSCGSRLVYDGTFSGVKVTGVGVATAYFLNHGLRVYSEENWREAEEYGN